MASDSKRNDYGTINTVAVSSNAHLQQTDDSNPPTRSGKPKVTLRKELGIISGVGLICGNVIGSGIFITSSTILGYTQSFGLTLITWVVGGLITITGALCYCELGTMIQKSGSEYAYILEAYSFGSKNKYLRTIGRMLAFTNVWYDFLVGNPASLAIPLLTFGRYASRPFFIDCQELPLLPVKMLALSALSEWLYTVDVRDTYFCWYYVHLAKYNVHACTCTGMQEACLVPWNIWLWLTS